MGGSVSGTRDAGGRLPSREGGDRPELRLLSQFAVSSAGATIDLKPASQRLLAYVALADHGIDRAGAAFRLWPDKDEPRAQANLRSALWRIRQQPAELVETTSTHVRLHPGVWVDARHGVQELLDADPDAILESGRRSRAVGSPDLGGDLLPDWYDDWLVIERERLRQLRLRCMERACRMLIDAGRWPDAIELGLRAIALEPLRESAHRLVIEAHLGQGNAGEALRQLRSCTDLLSTELGVDPSGELVALVDGVGARVLAVI